MSIKRMVVMHLKLVWTPYLQFFRYPGHRSRSWTDNFAGGWLILFLLKIFSSLLFVKQNIDSSHGIQESLWRGQSWLSCIAFCVHPLCFLLQLRETAHHLSDVLFVSRLPDFAPAVCSPGVSVLPLSSAFWNPIHSLRLSLVTFSIKPFPHEEIISAMDFDNNIAYK